jgi:hypothetical protein
MMNNRFTFFVEEVDKKEPAKLTVEQVLERLSLVYGSNVADPDFFPMTFDHQVKKIMAELVYEESSRVVQA